MHLFHYFCTVYLITLRFAAAKHRIYGDNFVKTVGSLGILKFVLSHLYTRDSQMYETMNEISRNNKSLNSITHGIFALHYITLGRSFLALLPTRIAIVTDMEEP